MQPYDKSDERPAVRLALMEERLGILIDVVKTSENATKIWREQFAANLVDTAKTIAVIHESQHDTQDKIDAITLKIESVEKQVSTKIGWAGFQGFWRIIIGITILITATGGVVTILRAFRVIP